MSAASLPALTQLQAHYALALSMQNQGRLEQAKALYAGILQAQPHHADALFQSGVIASHSGNHQEAVAFYQQAAALVPGHAVLRSNLGVSLRHLGRTEQALECFDKALAIDAGFADAWCNRGNILLELGRHEAALTSYSQALDLRPGFALAHFNRGNALREMQRYQEALADYDHAIAFAPDHAQAWCNRGITLRQMQQYKAAIASYDRAVALRPDYAQAWTNRGLALQALLQLEAAVESFDRALAIGPDSANVHVYIALALLLQGQFERAWPHYEWRTEMDGKQQLRRQFAAPRWDGKASLQDRTILIHYEQGLGDVIQFCRYTSMLAALGARVILEAQWPLVPLMQGLGGVAQLVPAGHPLPAFDYHCPLLSLPMLFRTDLNSIPAGDAYLSADPARVDLWSRKLAPKTIRRVGLCWSGNNQHANDSQRSLALGKLLSALPADFQYISLQKELRDTDKSALAVHSQLLQLGDEIKDFADTAALCELMDLIISVDTSVAHLAGALGKPVWIMLPFSPDWRWLLDRTDSPWYPSARLYRQSAPGEWGAVFEAISKDLRAMGKT